MTAYYNEIDPHAAQWLRNLIAEGLIPAGDVDERSIEDVTPDDLRGYTQCHFFAGIGGWPLALALAGWPASRPVWTGSCPCQPFSGAGKGAGFADERHLWPAWQHLIAQCRPAVIFGEQVADKRIDPWIDLVQADMEGMGYAFGCVAFPASSIGSPHRRDRAYWVADTDGRHASAERQQRGGEQRQQPQDGGAGRLADASRGGRREEHANGGRGSVGDSPQGLAAGLVHGGSDLRPGPTNGQWGPADWLCCTDGKWRPVEPGTFPLAHGIPGRVGRLRAYGNAIVPQAGAAFVSAYLESEIFL